VVQFPFYCPKVHRLLDNFEVIVNSVFCGVHRLHKKVSSLGLLAHGQYSLRCFDPCLFGLDLLNFWHVHFIRIFELLCKLRIFGHQFFEFYEWKLSCVTKRICSV
jgi:hypothetical protein